MERERILGILREHEPELKASGLLHLRLFGSVVRNETTVDSDIDLLFDYDSSDGDLLHAYGTQDRLTELLGAPVHLSSAQHIKALVLEHALREAVVAF